jgi:hypothetical protein
MQHATGATTASQELETMPGWVLLRAEVNSLDFAACTPGLGIRAVADRVAWLRG